MKIPFFLMAVAMCCPAVSNSQELESVVVTGTYSHSSGDALVSSVTIIDRNQIESMGKTNLADVLRTITGINLRQAGGAGGVSGLYIRGAEPNFTLVMIDGMKVNDTTNSRGGGFNFNSFDVESIERVEVLRGTQSATYGGDALAGVINIITKTPQQGPAEQRAFLELGEDGAFNAGYGIGFSNGTVAAKANISTVDRGELTVGSEYENTQVVTSLAWQAAEGTRASWQFRWLDDEGYSFPEQSGGDKYALSDDLEFNSSEESSHRISWQQALMGGWQSELAFTLFSRDSVMGSPGVIPFDFVPPNNADTNYENTEFQWVNSVDITQEFSVNLGLVLQSEEGESMGTLAGVLDTSFTLDRDNKAAFIELAYEYENAFSTHLNVRRDDPDNLDAETSFNVGLTVPFAKNFKLSANVGEGFKLPSFFALGHPLVGNAELKPERAKTTEIGLSYRHDVFGLAAITWFENEFTDLVDFDAELFTNVNRAMVDTDGFEVSWSFNSSENTSIRLHATFTDVDTHNENVILSARPEQLYGAVFSLQVKDNLSTNIDFRHVSEQYDTSLYSGQSLRETLDAYDVVNANVIWHALDNVSLRLSLDNLLDETYFESIGFSSPGRNVRLKVAVDF